MIRHAALTFTSYSKGLDRRARQGSIWKYKSFDVKSLSHSQLFRPLPNQGFMCLAGSALTFVRGLVGLLHLEVGVPVVKQDTPWN